MAFGDIRGTLTNSTGSVTNPFAASGSVAVSAGDVGVAVFGERGNLTVGTATDNLGNTWTAQNAGNDAGTDTGRAYWFYFSSGGTLTSLSFVTTASSDDAAVRATIFEGPFESSPLDASPSNVTNDISTPWTSPATGTLAQADELIVAWITMTNGAAQSVNSPFTLDGNTNSGTGANTVGTALARQVVSATTTQSCEFTGGSPSSNVIGIMSFKKQAAAFNRAPTMFLVF